MRGDPPRTPKPFSESWIKIADPQDPRVNDFVGLRDAALRRQREQADGSLRGVFIAEGDLVVQRAITAGYELRAVLADVTRPTPFDFEVPPNVPIYAGLQPVVAAITGYHLHRGVLASFFRPQEPTADSVVRGASRLVVCEAVLNPTNLGIIARSAAALGMQAMLLDPTSADPLYRRASRVSMGATFFLPHARLTPFAEGLAWLSELGFELVALTADPNESNLAHLGLEHVDKLALILGSEGYGLSASTLEASSIKGNIPLNSQIDSLNVAAAAAIACFLAGNREASE